MIARKIILAGWLLIMISTIGILFWHNEWKYNLPTPLPLNYKPVPTGTHINLSSLHQLKKGRPVFLHFFNPACPCSRFNMQHFRSLVKKYDNRISFALVLIDDENNWTEKKIKEKYGLDIPVYADRSIAKSCGVYSTPQAAIIDTDNKLYFRGNYNRSRYCTDEKTNYAQIAIDSLLHHDLSPILNASAFKSYGCVLQDCKKQ